MHKAIKQFLFWGALVFIVSCRPKVDTESSFTDLPAYFQTECDRLQKSNIKISKSVVLGTNSDSMLITKPVWKEELSHFMKYDLNTAVRENLIKTDSSVSSNGKLITYNISDPKSELQSVQIFFRGNQISNIHIKAGKEGIYGIKQLSLFYDPSKGYLIEKTEHPSLGKTTAIKIKSVFLQ